MLRSHRALVDPEKVGVRPVDRQAREGREKQRGDRSTGEGHEKCPVVRDRLGGGAFEVRHQRVLDLREVADQQVWRHRVADYSGDGVQPPTLFTRRSASGGPVLPRGYSYNGPSSRSTGSTMAHEASTS